MNGRGLMLFGLGVLWALIAIGARIWVEDLHLDVPWWKWVLLGGWYVVANLTVAAGMTLRGENERRASNMFFIFFGGPTVVAGIVIAAALWAGQV